ncbi:MAG: hypothetical protein AB7V22_06575, partial [Kiritimatiellia bacterium]
LSSAQKQLQRLTNRSTFPAPGNVQAMEKQLGIYREYLEGLKAEMKKGQRTAESVTRDRFRQLLEETLRQLANGAREKGVALPANFAFGFQRYAEGVLPAEEEMNRLVDQLSSVKALCEILYEAGIGELVAVERTTFEKDAQAAPVEEEYGRRSARGRTEAAVAAPSVELEADPLGLYTREHYVLSYRAHDAANWRVLDRLAKAAPFVVATQMEIVNSARPAVLLPPKAEAPPPAAPKPTSVAGWQAPGSPAPVGAPEPEVLPRELRIVAGQELPNVRLEVDFYRFVEPAAEAVAQGEERP